MLILLPKIALNDNWYPFRPEAWKSLIDSVHSVTALPRNFKNRLWCALQSSGCLAGKSQVGSSRV